MTTRFTTSLAAAVAAVTMATAAPMLIADTSAKASVSGQDQPQRRQGPGIGGPGGGPGMRRGGPLGFGGPEFRNLDLSDDQKAQLQKIRDARQAEFKAAADKLGAAHQGMRALLEADSINEGAIRAKSQEVAAADADLMILNAKVRQESLQVLTSEQQAKLKEQRTARGEGRQRQPRGQQ